MLERFAKICACSVLVFVAALAVAHGNDACNNTSSEPAPSDYDILILALQWPFSTCVSLGDAAGDACQSPPAAFVIDGLWPARVAGEQPRCCVMGLNATEAAFSLAPIVDLTPQLLRLWPDMSANADPKRLWREQWERHGSCSNFSCRAYFRKVLELSRRFDFLHALSAQGVVASARRSHRFSHVQQAANVAVGGSQVRLRCHRSTHGTVLDALHVCTDRDGLRTVDCPASCMEDDQACCRTGQRIQIPFWSFERNVENTTSSSRDTESKLSPKKQVYFAGMAFSTVAGIVVLTCACAAWMFRKFYESHLRATGINSHPYQRIR